MKPYGIIRKNSIEIFANPFSTRRFSLKDVVKINVKENCIEFQFENGKSEELNTNSLEENVRRKLVRRLHESFGKTKKVV